MIRTLLFTVSPEEDGRKAGELLRKRGISHTLLVTVKRQGMLFSAGEPVRQSRIMRRGEILSVTLREETGSDNIAPEEGPLSILYEDPDLLAVDKEAGIPVHPSRAHVYGTLAGRVMKKFEGEIFTFRAVNRLDLGTSGIVLVAKNALAANWMASRAGIEKEYLGLARGKFPEEATIDRPVARESEGAMRRVVREDGERAVTEARRVSFHGGFSLVRFRLLTGRTHQIRVHAASIGHPLLGDPLYGEGAGENYGLARQALHASKISFLLPYSEERITLSSPLPEDVLGVIRAHPAMEE
ncbi:MAG: RluA family pseudouridine synthase [Clostridia bacterium]|nr:RluA family pseudouridine synthase [Clostridia bacterium]